MSAKDKEYGEGNYKASRQYNQATKQFVDSGRVEEAAREAQPDSEQEAMEMANAEAEGRRRAKEEDPALRRGTQDRKDSQDDPRGTPVNERSADDTKTPKPGEERE
jgi:hypothetical protein